jgi:hypothetical protein
MQYWPTPANLRGFLDRTLAIRQRMVSLSHQGNFAVAGMQIRARIASEHCPLMCRMHCRRHDRGAVNWRIADVMMRGPIST